jgi:hypothetical protein
VTNERGEISTYDMPDGEGKLKKLPMLRGGPPPCSTCPKLEGIAEKKPLDKAEDLFGEAWFWDARQHFFECRAVGDFGSPDPLMRAIIAEFDIADRRSTGKSSDRTAAMLEVIAKRK